MFRGTYVALVTPFKNGKVNAEEYKKLVNFVIDNGVDGIVPCGTTGESATLSHQEHLDVVKYAQEFAEGRVKIVAGAGSNCTNEALYLSEKIAAMNVDGLLVITPYYNKPTQSGLYRHYKALAGNVDLPIILYTVPGRTGVNLEIPTLQKLTDECSNIVAIKDATGDLDYTCDLLSDTDLTVLSGNDHLTFPMMALGAAGCISVAGNIIPKATSQMVNRCLKGDFVRARAIHFEYLELCRKLFVETNPIPVKTALSLMGMMKLEFRMPLCEMEDENLEILKQAMVKHKVL